MTSADRVALRELADALRIQAQAFQILAEAFTEFAVAIRSTTTDEHAAPFMPRTSERFS
jgi:histone H3/H4